MISFTSLFPSIAKRETLTVHIGQTEPPEELFVLSEYYCELQNCDCRRVLLRVFRDGEPERILASISYAFEPPPRGALWEDWGQLYLEPVGVQSEYSGSLLALVRKGLDTVPEWIPKLQRHYSMVKEAHDAVYAGPRPPTNQPIRRLAPSVGCNAPCPCGSGRKFKHCCEKATSPR